MQGVEVRPEARRGLPLARTLDRGPLRPLVEAEHELPERAGGDLGRECARVGDPVGLRGVPRRPARGAALMRIIAGERKGHTIYAPKGLDTRPTSDRVRENVFNIVAPWVEDARVLDLFAGSG